MAETTTQGTQQQLYITLSPSGEIKIGTCMHCVVQEQGRPERAWNPDGDKELDFPRDELIAQLAQRGVHVEILEQYVCP
jgi:hypothetical protein